MIKTVSAALIASLITAGSMAMASTGNPASIEAKKTEIKAKIASMQQSFSGLVTRTEKGLILETSEGTYMLEGLSLEEIIGKEVYVTGVVKNNSENDIIYVVRADFKE